MAATTILFMSGNGKGREKAGEFFLLPLLITSFRPD